MKITSLQIKNFFIGEISNNEMQKKNAKNNSTVLNKINKIINPFRAKEYIKILMILIH